MWDRRSTKREWRSSRRPSAVRPSGSNLHIRSPLFVLVFRNIPSFRWQYYWWINCYQIMCEIELPLLLPVSVQSAQGTLKFATWTLIKSPSGLFHCPWHAVIFCPWYCILHIHVVYLLLFRICHEFSDLVVLPIWDYCIYAILWPWFVTQGLLDFITFISFTDFPFCLTRYLWHPLTLVCSWKTSVSSLSNISYFIFLNKIFLPSSDLGVLPKDLWATSTERFASCFSEAPRGYWPPSALFHHTVDIHGRKNL